jgi:sRNA-binding protein
METVSGTAPPFTVSPLATRECDRTAAKQDRKAARRAGMKDAAKVIHLLRQKWPTAFPSRYVDVRPLASSVTKTVATEMGWNEFYAAGVLMVWKSRDPYCDAVLRGGARYDLNGAPTAELVDDHSKELALKQRMARSARLKRRAEERNIVMAAVSA